MRTALVLFGFVGAMLGSAFGYLSFAAGSGSEGANGFEFWMFHEWPFLLYDPRSGHWGWALAGAFCGVALPIAIRKFLKSN